MDPELGVNIVDLGLVYRISLDDGKITLDYTTTTPGCPMRRYLKQMIEKALDSVDGVTGYELNLVFEPEWCVDMIVPNVEFFSVPPPQIRV
jgi:metal-sulfur cluster biosynthetic enzyme